MSRLEATPVGDVSFDGERATLNFEIRLPHPPEEVWKAITDPRELSQWYMTQAVIEGRKGGFIDLRTGPGQFHATGRILEWEPPELFEYEWKVRPGELRGAGEDAIVRWELERDGEATILRLAHRKLTRDAGFGAAPYTHVILERLAAQLDGRPLPDLRARAAEVQGKYVPRGASSR